MRYFSWRAYGSRSEYFTIWIISFVVIRVVTNWAADSRASSVGVTALMTVVIYAVACAAARRLKELRLPAGLAFLIALGMAVLSMTRGWLVMPIWLSAPFAAAIVFLHLLLCFCPPRSVSATQAPS